MPVTVKEARERAGLSQVDAGRAIGVTEPTYRKYEREPWLMSIEKAAALARIFGLDFMDLQLRRQNERAS